MIKALVATRYHATFDLDDSGKWLAQIDEIPQVHTFGPTLGKAREYVVDALALWLDVSATQVKDTVDFHPAVFPLDVQYVVDEAIAMRVALECMAAASVGLVDDAHLSLRDASEVLGLSHQRVQQLIAAQRGALTPVGAGAQGVAQDIARSLKEYLPGGQKEELGVLAAGVALGLAIAWTEARN
jgi:predicted RNase H-like HicB family nuclease